MKVYKFYLSQDDETVRQAIENGNNMRDVHPLYAYTNSKEIRDEFVEMHNMKCFYEVVSKMSKSEWVEFANNNRGRLLEYFDYKTRVYDDAGVMHLTDEATNGMSGISILSTNSERLQIESNTDIFNGVQLINGEFADISWPNPWILKPKYQESLLALAYDNFWKLLRDPAQPRLDEYAPEGYDPDTEWCDATLDEAAAYVTEYKDILRK